MLNSRKLYVFCYFHFQTQNCWKDMQVSKAKPLLFALKSRAPRNFSKCLCHHHYAGEKKTLRGGSYLPRVTYGKPMPPLTFSVINTIQRQLCAGSSGRGGQESQDPPQHQGHGDDPKSSEVSADNGSPKSALDFQEVESRQEGLLDEEIEDFYHEEEEDQEETEWVPPVSLTSKKYKQRKHESDPFLLISGASDPKSEWLAMDIGNAFLHVMMPDTRQRYDLEGLWMPGEGRADQDGGEGEEETGEFDWIKEFRLQRETVHN
ncbi:uncharacterized protein LOC134242632 [Saccostrea cucullata]|uniref:uncharacterized protein LOC134242632 n=1 Tax=Saccostrea cuccullata TaxID=36930 RepID=UPI002ED60747